MEKRFKGWAKLNKNISFCPLCRTKILKDGGCNQMTCGFCQYEFCWLCHAPAPGTYPEHFKWYSPDFCGAGQETGDPGPCRRCLYKLLQIIIFIVLFPVVFPLVLVFTTPLACCALAIKCIEDSPCHCCRK